MYLYEGRVGEYPDSIWHSDSFEFEKLASSDGSIVDKWSNWGEEFDDYSLSSEAGTPSEFALHPVYPNPFNSVTTLSYDLPKDDNVLLLVYDVMGREVVRLMDEYKSAGTYEITFDASNLVSGVYFVRLVAGDFTETQKIVLMK